MMAEIILPGRPYTKKNSQQIYSHGDKRSPAPSKKYKQYETDCLKMLMGYRGPKFQKGARLNLAARYWMPNRASWPDLVGLIQSTQDILEKAGVIDNDRDIVTLDGSQIMGVDKDNPRAYVVLQEVEIKEARA